MEQGDTLSACCPINVTEVYAGMRPLEASNTQGFLRRWKYYPITSWPVARLAGLFKGDDSKRGVTLSTTDVIIAAVAYITSFSLLFTEDNLKHYPNEGASAFTPLPWKLEHFRRFL